LITDGAKEGYEDEGDVVGFCVGDIVGSDVGRLVGLNVQKPQVLAQSEVIFDNVPGCVDAHESFKISQ
jgi:hypothetical protein